MPDPPTADTPERYGWGFSPSRFLSRVLRTFEAVVGTARDGPPPTGPHILFLVVVVLTLLTLVAAVLFAALDRPTYLLVTVLLFVAGVLVLALLPTRLLPPTRGAGGGDSPPAPGHPQQLEDLAVRTNEIYEHLKADGHPDVLEERFELTVTPGWDLVAKSTVRLRAVAPFLVLLRRLSGEPPVGSFWDLGLDVSATLGNSRSHPVVALPALGNGSNVSVLLFFPPGVPAGAELEYTMTWRWPGQWGPLRDAGVDTWTVLAKSGKPIGRVRLEFRLPADRPVELANRGGGGGELVAATKDPDGARVYVWEARQVGDGQRLTIELRRLA